MAARATARLHELNGRKFTKSAEGGDEAAALFRLTAELKLTSGILDTVNVTVAEPLAGIVANANDSYSDANFVFREGTRVFNVHFEQLSNDYREIVGGVATGYVDIENGDITDWADANYPDATLQSGSKYVR